MEGPQAGTTHKLSGIAHVRSLAAHTYMSSPSHPAQDLCPGVTRVSCGTERWQHQVSRSQCDPIGNRTENIYSPSLMHACLPPNSPLGDSPFDYSLLQRSHCLSGQQDLFVWSAFLVPQSRTHAKVVDAKNSKPASRKPPALPFRFLCQGLSYAPSQACFQADQVQSVMAPELATETNQLHVVKRPMTFGVQTLPKMGVGSAFYMGGRQAVELLNPGTFPRG